MRGLKQRRHCGQQVGKNLGRAIRPAYEGIETVVALKIVAWRFELSDLTVAA